MIKPTKKKMHLVDIGSKFQFFLSISYSYTLDHFIGCNLGSFMYSLLLGYHSTQNPFRIKEYFTF